jgi:hypothetical protein
MKKLIKLARFLKAHSLFKEASGVLDLRPVEHPDWRDEWEEPRDYSAEGVMPPATLKTNYEEEASQEMLGILKDLGVTIASDSLGSGAHGTTYRCIYKEKPAVAKIEFYPSIERREFSEDVKRWEKLMGIWDTVPEFVRQHIPKVFLAKEGRFFVDGEARSLYFKYQIIVLEELRPLPKKLRHSIEGAGWKAKEEDKSWLWEKELDNLYPEIWELFLKNEAQPPSRGDFSKVILSDASRNNLSIPESIRKIILDKAKETYPESDERVARIIKDANHIILKYQMAFMNSIPRWSTSDIPEINRQSYVPDDVKSLENAINWLRNNGMEAGDIIASNIMVDSNGVLKISDLGRL